MSALTDRQQQILDFEKSWWRHPGAKDTAVLEIFGCSAARYYQELGHIIDLPEALAYDPTVVARLRRLRDTRRNRRTTARARSC